MVDDGSWVMVVRVRRLSRMVLRDCSLDNVDCDDGLVVFWESLMLEWCSSSLVWMFLGWFVYLYMRCVFVCKRGLSACEDMWWWCCLDWNWNANGHADSPIEPLDDLLWFLKLHCELGGWKIALLAAACIQIRIKKAKTCMRCVDLAIMKSFLLVKK